jgi:hypothetical protein
MNHQWYGFFTSKGCFLLKFNEGYTMLLGEDVPNQSDLEVRSGCTPQQDQQIQPVNFIVEPVCV